MLSCAGWEADVPSTTGTWAVAGVVCFAGMLAAGMPVLCTIAAPTMASIGATAGMITQVATICSIACTPCYACACAPLRDAAATQYAVLS